MPITDERSLMIFCYKADTLFIELDNHVPFKIFFPFLLRTVRRTIWAVILSKFIDLSVDGFAFQRFTAYLVFLLLDLHNYYTGLRINSSIFTNNYKNRDGFVICSW